MRVKRSVSLAIRSADGERVLLVRRPSEDAELPGVWGLPAASLTGNESWEEAVSRAARDKLGVTVQSISELNQGVQHRPTYTLEMRLYQAEIAAGQLAVPQRNAGVTQYSDWRWGTMDQLRPAASLGSLCSQLMLATT